MRRPTDLRRAWIAIALIPVAFVIAAVVGEGLMSAAGYEAEETPSLSFRLLVGVPVTLLAMAPAFVAVLLARRVRREVQSNEPTIVIVIGSLVLAYFILTTAVGLLAQ